MGSGKEFNAHQQKIIRRYYDQKDVIMLEKLQMMIGDLVLADSEKKQQQLWDRVGKAMVNLKVPETVAQHILAKRDPSLLAQHVTAWLSQARG